jgi:ubiquinone/menaquinone biosynthesis C-methylase UbiE
VDDGCFHCEEESMTRKTRYVPALGFNVLTPLYDPLVALTTREETFKRLLIAQAGVRAGQRVLDLACGTGTLAVWLKQAAPGAVVVGIDGDATMLERARRKAAQAGADIRFDLGLSHRLTYADASFERVVSSLFFHHLRPDEKRATLREAYRVLVPGGELHVADWGKPANLVLRAMFYAVQMLDGFENTRDNVQGRLGRFFEEAGFKEVSMPAQLHTPLGTIALYRAGKR